MAAMAEPRRKSPTATLPDQKVLPWTFLTNHAHVLLTLKQSPAIALREVAMLVGITERSVQRIVADLEAEGFIKKAKSGRSNTYSVIGKKRLRHPLEAHHTVDELFKAIS